MKNFILKQSRKHNTITKIKNHIDYLLNENTASHYKSKIHSLTENVKETYKRIYFENEKYISHQKKMEVVDLLKPQRLMFYQCLKI